MNRYCGTDIPPTIISTNGYMEVNFVSDHYVGMSGFEIYYVCNGTSTPTPTPTPTPPSECKDKKKTKRCKRLKKKGKCGKKKVWKKCKKTCEIC